MRGWALALVLAFCGAAVHAQDAPRSTLRAPVLTIDIERVIVESDLGQTLNETLGADRLALAEENRRLADELREEELQLTAQRPTMSTEDFRVLADAFDTKVQAIREEQDAKEEDLARRTEDERRKLLSEIQPILAQIMIETGAAVILERRNVFLSFDSIDVTDLTLERIDRQGLAREDE